MVGLRRISFRDSSGIHAIQGYFYRASLLPLLLPLILIWQPPYSMGQQATRF